MIALGNSQLQGTEALSAKVSCSLGLFDITWRLGSVITRGDCLGVPALSTIFPLLFIHVGIPRLCRDLLGRILSGNILERREVQRTVLVLFRVFCVVLFFLFVCFSMSPLSARRT